MFADTAFDRGTLVKLKSSADDADIIASDSSFVVNGKYSFYNAYWTSPSAFMNITYVNNPPLYFFILDSIPVTEWPEDLIECYGYILDEYTVKPMYAGGFRTAYYGILDPGGMNLFTFIDNLEICSLNDEGK